MQQHWLERKGNIFANSPNQRSMTPKLGSNWRDELERTPERLKTDISQLLSYTPSPSFHQKKSSGLSSTLIVKTPTKGSDSNNSGEKIKTHKTQRSQNNLSKTFAGTSLSQLKNKTLNNQSPSIQAITSPTNNENNYLNQVNIMMQKITKLKQELEVSRERETQHLTKLSSLEKENKSLLVMVEEKEKKIQEITRKAKEDKIKMYQFLTELEAYKEANAELQKNKEREKEREREKEKDESTVRLSEIADSLKKNDKPIQISRCIQTISDGVGACTKCDNVQNYAQSLLERLNEVDENSRQLLEEYSQMKEILESTKKSEISYAKACSDFEAKYNDLQKDLSSQTSICNQLIAENTTILTSLSSLYETNTTSSSKPTSKIKECMPSSLKALVLAERISNLQVNSNLTSY